VISRLAISAAGLPDPELAAHMLAAYADEAARLVLDGYEMERIRELTRRLLARVAPRRGR
jgi:hypothetical protein